MQSNRRELAQQLYTASHIEGQFVLRSGVTSSEYFDKYLFEADPVLLRRIAETMAEMVPPDCELLAGLEMGGIPVATILSQVTGLPVLFVRKKAKEYGTCKLAEGGDVAEKRLLVVEDVVTSGGQIIESCRALRGRGARVESVVCVIDRESGGAENLAKEGLLLRPLFTMSELKSSAQS